MNSITIVNYLFDFYNDITQTIYNYVYQNVQVLNWTQADLLCNPLFVAYNWYGTQYTTPFFTKPCDKQQHATIVSVMIETSTGDENITDEFISTAGPFHNFFGQPVRVCDVVPYTEVDFKALHVMVIVEGQIMTYSYEDYYQLLDFQHYIYWGRFHPEEYNKVLKRLDYLCLN
jgi:hypothetical protein